MSYEKFFREAQKTRQAVADHPKIKAEMGAEATPEEMVIATLRERVRERAAERKAPKANSKKRQAKKASPPVFAGFLLATAIGAAVLGYFNPRALDSIPNEIRSFKIGSVEIELFGSANAASASSEKEKVDKSETKQSEAKKSAEPAEKSTGAKSEKPEIAAEGREPDVRQWTAEEVSFFKKLSERKEELDRREAELNHLEEELQKQKKGLEEKIAQLEKTRKEISATLKDRVVQDQEKVAKLVDVYSNMKPAQAAKVIETLNEDLAVTVLDRMKKKNAAEVLNAMSSTKAKKLSEMLTGYEAGPTRSKASE